MAPNFSAILPSLVRSDVQFSIGRAPGNRPGAPSNENPRNQRRFRASRNVYSNIIDKPAGTIRKPNSHFR
jgi:hypothetical protein